MSATGKRAPTRLQQEGLRRSQNLEAIARRIGSCRKCLDDPDGAVLEQEPRPILQVSSSARIAIFGQAPGIRAQMAGLPFKDPSGVRLRAWMGIDEATFYYGSRIAIAPMGFCFPGYDAQGSDLPPRRECAPLWREELLGLMPQIELALLIGGHAQKWHLGKGGGATSRETVRKWEAVLEASTGHGAGQDAGDGSETSQSSVLPRAALFPLPHPSWRNNAWLKANPWFDEQLLPCLRQRVRQALPVRRT